MTRDATGTIRLKIFVGDCRGQRMIDILKKNGWGRVVINMRPKPYEGEGWLLDNGAYSDYLQGKPFNEKRFLQRMREADKVNGCSAVVVPDRVGEGNDSLEFSVEWLQRIPIYHTKWLVLQDGMTKDAILPNLEWFDGVFLGGTNQFKIEARSWCEWAHEHGLTFHYGRAGTLKKVRHAMDIGADSLDSSFPLWTYQRFLEFVDICNGIIPQQRFDFVKEAVA